MPFDPTAVNPLDKPPPTNDFVPDGQLFENPASAAQPTYENYPVSTGSAIGALLETNVTAGIGRWFARRNAEIEADPLATFKQMRRNQGIPESDDTPDTYAAFDQEKSPVISAQEANARYAPKGVNLFDKDTPDSVAKVIGSQKTEEIKRDEILSRWSNQTALPGRIGTSIVASLLDPLNDAAMFVPGVGEEAVLANIGRVGLSTSSVVARTLARGISGATAGAAGMAPIAALQYGLAQSEGSDYSLRDAMNDLMFGAVVGAVGHAGFGALREAGVLRPDEIMRERPLELRPSPYVDPGIIDAVRTAPADVTADGIRSAAAQVLSGREVNVDPVVGEPPATTVGVTQAVRAGSEVGFDANRPILEQVDKYADATPEQRIQGLIHELARRFEITLPFEVRTLPPEDLVGRLGEGGVRRSVETNEIKEAVVRVVNNVSPESQLAYATHEFGHVVQKTKFDTLPPEEKIAIRNAWKRDLSAALDRSETKAGRENVLYEQQGAALHEGIEEHITSQDGDPDELRGTKKQVAYNLTFEEWFANQTSKFLTTNAEAVTVADKFFKGIADFWRKLYETFIGRVGAVPEMEAFLRKQGKFFEQPTDRFGARDPSTVAKAQQDIYRNGYAPGIPQHEFDAAREAIYGKKEEPQKVTSAPSAASQKTAFTPQEFIAAYDKLKDAQGGFSAVEIFSIARELNVPIEALHDFLRAAGKSGDVVFYPTDSVHLPKEVTDAALHIEGHEPFITAAPTAEGRAKFAQARPAPETPAAKPPSSNASQGDKALAEWQAKFDAAKIALAPEDQAEIDAAKAGLDRANSAADGYAQAGECLTGAGI